MCAKKGQMHQPSVTRFVLFFNERNCWRRHMYSIFAWLFVQSFVLPQKQKTLFARIKNSFWNWLSIHFSFVSSCARSAVSRISCDTVFVTHSACANELHDWSIVYCHSIVFFSCSRLSILATGQTWNASCANDFSFLDSLFTRKWFFSASFFSNAVFVVIFIFYDFYCSLRWKILVFNILDTEETYISEFKMKYLNIRNDVRKETAWKTRMFNQI